MMDRLDPCPTPDWNACKAVNCCASLDVLIHTSNVAPNGTSAIGLSHLPVNSNSAEPEFNKLKITARQCLLPVWRKGKYLF